MVFFLEKETKSNIHVFVICQVSSTVQIIKYSIVRCLGTTMRFFSVKQLSVLCSTKWAAIIVVSKKLLDCMFSWL